METDRNGLTILDDRACRALLATVPVARVALAVNGVPVVLPVNVGVDGDTVVFRSAVGSKLDAALTQEVVAVEADHYDRDLRTGWSVVIKGRAHEVVEADAVGRARGLRLQPWGNPEADHFIAVRMDLVSGRSIGPPPDIAGAPDAAP